jgi:battenin
MAIGTSATAIWGFGVAIVATTITGISSSFGEAVIIGFNKFYPHEFIGSFSSGTGVAGVAGVSFMIGFKAAGLSDFVIFIIMLPFAAAYFFSFLFLYNRWHRYGSAVSDEDALLDSTPNDDSKADENETGNPVFSREQVRFVLKKAWFVCLNLGLVYFLEYVIITCFADRATLGHQSGDFWHSNAFLILQFCYQFGVLISRSSLSCVKIK